jgi:hypothetical protein
MIPKPPLGVMPEWLWREHRIKELVRAMKDNIDYNEMQVSNRFSKQFMNYVEEFQRHIAFLCVAKSEVREQL